MTGGSWAGQAGPVTVVVPATSANLGPGFDAFGVALDLNDEVTAEVAGDGFIVDVVGEGAGEVPASSRHLVVKTMLTALRRLGVAAPTGVRLRCVNRIPHARGLGSSSAAIVAGIALARALAPPPEADDGSAALQLAAELEGHPDNVAACLAGGFTIAWTEPAGAQAVRLEPSAAVRPVVYIPTGQGLTAHARAVIPDRVPHGDAVFNLSRAALFVHALTQEPELLMSATEDRLHQQYRSASMPQTADLVSSLRRAGVPAVVSGAGPSVLAFTGAFAGQPVPPPTGWEARSLRWSATGARMLGVGHADGDPVAASRVG
jgi:homoserine kinase